MGPIQAKAMLEASLLADQLRLLAPVGPVNTLKRSFQPLPREAITGKPNSGFTVLNPSTGTSGEKYALPQATEPWTHVPPSEVGRIGWQDYGRRIAPNVRSEILAYHIGLRWARKRGYPRYRWNYIEQALEKRDGWEGIFKRLEG